MNTVLAHGCFDILHLGHIRHLEEARRLGDRLVVSVTSDRHVNKGFGRPHFSAEQRREALLMLACVDEVIISDAATAVDVIRKIRPTVYVKGVDYAGSDDPNLAAECETVKAVGGRFHVTTTEKWSSTQLLRSIKLSDAALAYLERIDRRRFLDEILAAFDRADDKNIAFVGETIIDEYCYVRPLAKPSKEFVLATVADSVETFDGGIIAASRHGDWKNVSIITGTSITKTRFVDADFSRKLFEVYSATKIEPPGADVELLLSEVALADVVVALDFGHGFFGEVERDILQKAKFLALTAQTNAGNNGFNLVTNHRRADYVCVDEPEARLAVGDRNGPVDGVAAELARRMGASTATVTRGRRGSIAFDGGVAAVPAFVESGFDTMGAGDAFIAIAAPLVAAGLPVEMASFAGNVAGGLKTTILGHRWHVGRDDVVKNIEWLLK